MSNTQTAVHNVYMCNAKCAYVQVDMYGLTRMCPSEEKNGALLSRD